MTPVDVLLLGYGNPWRGDDGAGPAVIERLAQTPWPSGVRLVTLPQLTPDCAADFLAAQCVVLIDASVQLPPGQLRVHRVRPAGRPTLGHGWPAGAVVGLAQELGPLPHVLVCTLGVACLEPGATLSPLTAAAVERLETQLQRWLQRRLHRRPRASRQHQPVA